nr:ATP-binding protein [Myxococcus sp. MH1]
MTEPKWGTITSGATFEALATTIIFFEDSTAALFGRRGKDGGQDARSGDRTIVFQAKHHVDESPAKAITDAKNEAAKIKAYRQQEHSRFEQWKGVKHWRLVTNAPFNPTDKQVWDDEVVPLFAALNLTVDYWERRNLNAFLAKHPEIHRAFFENETRVLISVPEARERFLQREPFLRRAELGCFFGRDSELGEVHDFLASTQLFLVFDGAGGMGKTRLLFEAGQMVAGEGKWQVLWANVDSMAASGAWFGAVVVERPTLLLVDEPPDSALLQQLSEQLDGRMAQWKIIVAVRSPKDPVLHYLRSPRMQPRVRDLAIHALTDAAAEAMCADMFSTGKLARLPEEDRRDAARKLGQMFSRHPIWLTLAVHLLEERGNLTSVPETAKGLANDYLSEVERSQDDSRPEQVRELLRWVALTGTVNREDDSTIELIGDGSGAGGPVAVRRKLAALVSRRALVERGAHNRFVEIKPDVLRDHVLLSWLFAEVKFGLRPVVASDESKAIIEAVRNQALAGTLKYPRLSILVSLARTEFILRLSGNDVPLLAHFFESIQTGVPAMSARQRRALVDALEAVALFQPTATVALIKAMRQSTVSDDRYETVLGETVVGQNDVLLALARPLLRAAMGALTPDAQEAILRELCALAEVEADIAQQLERGLPNDGKRAATIIESVLEGSPQFWGNFDGAAKSLGDELLTELGRQSPTLGKKALLKSLVQPAIALVRRQTWSDQSSIFTQTIILGPDHSGWATRHALLSHIKDLLSADTTPIASRVELWRILAEAHGDINRHYRRGRQKDQRHKDQQYHDALVSNLVWAHDVLAQRAASLEELSAARSLWNWHHSFESDMDLKQASVQLEALYVANDLAAEFEPLLSLEEWERREPRIISKAAELATSRTPDDIAAFIERAVAFLGSEQGLSQLTGIFWYLGAHADTQEVLQTFIKHSLGKSSTSPRTVLGTVMATSWIASVRKGGLPARTCGVVIDLATSCGSDEQRVNLLLQIYGSAPTPRDVGQFSIEEIDLLRSQRQLFTDTGKLAAFATATALTINHAWPTLRTLIEDALRSVPPDGRAPVLLGLIDGLFWAVRESELARLPPGLGEWLLNQLLTAPNLDAFRSNAEWRLDEILRRTGRVHVSWLPEALFARKDMVANQDTNIRTHAVSYNFRFGKYVRHIAATDIGDSATTQAIDTLLSLLDAEGGMTHIIPDLLRDIDPEGIAIPAAVAARIQGASTATAVRQLARIGGAYLVGTAPWRTIAKAALAASQHHLTQKEQWSLFHVLIEGEFQGWSGTRGEVPEVFVSAVKEAKSALAAETDSILRPFWEWRLKVAEEDLREQEQRAKEDRGE